MALKDQITGREYEKFVETASGKHAVRIATEGDEPLLVSENGFSTGTNTRPNVTNVSSIVLAANPDRRYASFFNQSGSIMFFKFGAAAVSGEGYRVANNSMLEITAANLWLGDVHAIVNAGVQPLDVFEGEP